MASITTVRPSRLLAGQSRHIQGIGSKADDVKLRGESFVGIVTDQIIGEGIELNRSIDAASTLTIPMGDGDGDLRRHPLFQERFELELDGLRFVFVGKDKPATGELGVTLEARNVWRLRQHEGDDHGGTAKAYREKITRAEFWVGLVKTLKPEIPVYCPELHTVQPIESERQAAADAVERDVRRGKGLDTGAKLTVKGATASAEQIRLGDEMLRVAASQGATREVMIGLITAAINESTIKNLGYGDATSTGPLQVLSSTAANLGIDARNIAQIVGAFVNRGFTGAGSAKALSRTKDIREWLGLVMYSANGTPYPGLQYVPEATEWVDAFDGGATGARTVTETKRYPFTVPADEDWWAAGQRLFSEVEWRLFEAAGLIYVIAETDLLASRVRMRCREGAQGIDEITWAADTGVRVSELEVRGRARDWAAPPGSVAAVEGEGESIDGNYIVANIQSFLASPDVTVTLKRPTKPLPEPAAQTTTKTIGGFSGSAGAVEGPEAFQKMVAEAERIDKLDISYVFGGGHQTPAPTNGPFDCSSAVSRVLQVGGVLDTTMATGSLQSWGAEGPGDLVTVYVRNGGEGGGHTIMKLGDRYWGTSGENPGGGPGFITPTEGYLATLPIRRHPKGL